MELVSILKLRGDLHVLRLICLVLVIAGVILAIIGFITYNKILKYSVKNIIKLPLHYNAIKNAIRLMIVFFVIGFIIGGVDVFSNIDIAPMFYFVIIVFFVAAVFMDLLIFHMYTLTKTLVKKSEDLNDAFSEIEKNNIELQAEVDSQVGEIIGRDNLLHCVNRVAANLLSLNIDKFDDTVIACLEDLGGATASDRITVWKNFEKDSRLHCKKIYVWRSNTCNCKPESVYSEIPYDDFMMDWKQILASGKNISGMVKNMDDMEREVIVPDGILSVLIVPLFLQGHFWGYIGFDDCKEERTFTDFQSGMLKSAGVMIATALHQNENIQKLMKAREEALSSTKSKSEFLSNMSHEIRTPINAITGMTSIALKSDSIEKTKECLEKIDASSSQLLALINDILDISKIEAGKMELVNETFDLFKTISNVKLISEVKAAEKKQDFKLAIADNVPRFIKGDSVRISQVLLNLLSNAIKFTDEKGEISLSVKSSDTYDSGDKYIIRAEVTDNGIGIPEELQAHLFDAFEQAEKTTSRRFGGTGLGLTISKQITNLMGGDIIVKSEVGVGSTFTAIFKMEKGFESDLSEISTIADVVVEKEYELSGRSTMIVDDIEINRDIVESILSEKDMKVYCFENGKDAVDAFRVNPVKYELILMDIHMPLMDGYEATRQIRAMDNGYGSKVPIIAMTANAFDEDIKKCKAVGMNDHIAKPIDYDRMFKLMNHYLNR